MLGGVAVFEWPAKCRWTYTHEYKKYRPVKLEPDRQLLVIWDGEHLSHIHKGRRLRSTIAPGSLPAMQHAAFRFLLDGFAQQYALAQTTQKDQKHWVKARARSTTSAFYRRIYLFVGGEHVRKVILTGHFDTGTQTEYVFFLEPPEQVGELPADFFSPDTSGYRVVP